MRVRYSFTYVENQSAGYYRIKVTLSDLSEEPADVVVSVCLWLTPDVQNYGLGQEETYEGRMRQIEHFPVDFEAGNRVKSPVGRNRRISVFSR